MPRGTSILEGTGFFFWGGREERQNAVSTERGHQRPASVLGLTPRSPAGTCHQVHFHEHADGSPTEDCTACNSPRWSPNKCGGLGRWHAELCRRAPARRGRWLRRLRGRHLATIGSEGAKTSPAIVESFYSKPSAHDRTRRERKAGSAPSATSGRPRSCSPPGLQAAGYRSQPG